MWTIKKKVHFASWRINVWNHSNACIHFFWQIVTFFKYNKMSCCKSHSPHVGSGLVLVLLGSQYVIAGFCKGCDLLGLWLFTDSAKRRLEGLHWKGDHGRGQHRHRRLWPGEWTHRRDVLLRVCSYYRLKLKIWYFPQPDSQKIIFQWAIGLCLCSHQWIKKDNTKSYLLEKCNLRIVL